MRPILLQGAVGYELDVLLSALCDGHEVDITNMRFYQGTIHDIPVVVSRTGVGLVRAAAATAIGIERFHPAFIINQGTAGAHKTDLHVGDIVVGASCVNINSFEAKTTAKYDGVDPSVWSFSKRSLPRYADKRLLAHFEKTVYMFQEKYVGVLGSGDIFNREHDRIRWISDQLGTLSEDMESAAVYDVCEMAGVPCIGIRIISNNELTLEAHDRSIAGKVQQYVIRALADGALYRAGDSWNA